MQHQDVERILRDVVSVAGLRVSILRVDSTPTGWRTTVRDLADRVITIDLPDGPAALRAAAARWVETAS